MQEIVLKLLLAAICIGCALWFFSLRHRQRALPVKTFDYQTLSSEIAFESNCQMTGRMTGRTQSLNLDKLALCLLPDTQDVKVS